MPTAALSGALSCPPNHEALPPDAADTPRTAEGVKQEAPEACAAKAAGVEEGDAQPMEADVDDDGGVLKTASSKATMGSAPLTHGQIALIFMTCALPNAILILLFSAVGFGLDIYAAVAPQTMNLLGDAFISFSSITAVVLYIFDFSKWRPLVRAGASLPLFIMGAVGVVLKGRKYPWGPMLMLMFLIAFLLGVIRATVCRNVYRHKFYRTVSFMTFSASLCVLAVWLIWILAGGHQWNRETKDDLIAKSSGIYDSIYSGGKLSYDEDCGPDAEPEGDKLTRKNIKRACAKAATIWFLLYCSPFIAVICNLVAGVFCFLQGMLALDTSSAFSLSRLQKILRQFVILMVLLVMGMYASVNISGASLLLGSTLMAFFASGIFILIIWTYLEIGADATIELVKRSKFTQQLVMIWRSDWARAIFVGAFNVMIPFFIAINMLNMSVRRARGLTDSQDAYTPSARKLVNELSEWNWVGIFNKLNILGELFFMFQVGVAKATYVFLSWLNEALEKSSYGASIVLVVIVGYTMFLLPPVPGVPVYVFAGIVLAEQGRKNPSIGWFLGCAIAMCCGFILKQLACVGQYMIGFFMGKSLKIQQLIGVDKIPTRAIETILKQKGLTVGKVAVLVGGPDWPTSVTCGILGVNIPQMMWGTVPVIAIVAPCVLSGACLARVSPGEDSMWSLMAKVAVGVSLLVNVGGMVVAAIKIMGIMQNEAEELAKPRPEHEAVAALTRKEQALNEAHKEVTRWQSVTPFWKGLIYTSAALQLLSGFIFLGASEACFRPFSISSRIGDDFENDGLEGNALSIVLLPGWFSLGLFLIGCCLHVVFVKKFDIDATRRLNAQHGK